MNCKVEGCDSRPKQQGLCSKHYWRWYRHGGTDAKKRYAGEAAERNEAGEKWCPRCKRWLTEDNFHRATQSSDLLKTPCKLCHVVARFGLTGTDYLALLESQGGGCAICGSTEPGLRSMPVDHDHACCPDNGRTCGECNRGVLCPPCNHGLGSFRDNPALLREAADYLERWNSKQHRKAP